MDGHALRVGGARFSGALSFVVTFAAVMLDMRLARCAASTGCAA